VTPSLEIGTGDVASVSAFVEKKVLVRHFTGGPPDLAPLATAYLESEDDLLLTDLVAAETVYVPTIARVVPPAA